MSDETFDLCVIGGGIAGVGVLQAAAAAGYRAILLESQDVAAGTSSRSSKLIHGGLRYLETMQFSLVRESLRERKVLLRIAPDLVKLVPFYIPVYSATTRSRWQLRIGLSLYALLGNLRKEARFRTLPPSEWDKLDGLRRTGLRTVFEYYDGQTDDAALSRAVLSSACELGAKYELPAEMQSAQHEGQAWRVGYSLNGVERSLTARTIVNAGGPWVEEVRSRIQPKPPGFAVDLVQGTHIEVDEPLKAGVYYMEAVRDRRAVFTIPWKGHTLVGTTENVFSGRPGDVTPLNDEIEYLLETYRHYFPDREAQVLDAWAGSRVLPRTSERAFDRPREVTLVTDQPNTPTVLSIYGGKLTGYRATAEKVIEKLKPTLGARTAIGRTDELPLRPVDSL